MVAELDLAKIEGELKDKLLETKIARKKLKLNDVENSARILDDIIMGKDSKKIENR